MQSLVILRAHNFYRQAGGEDGVFESEESLLLENGHSVVRYEDHNVHIGNNSVRAGLGAVWNHSAYRRLYGIASRERPDVAHFHNTFPLTSPAAYYALKRLGVPVVQTLHNYRLLCAGATLYREGNVCEECIQQRSLRPALQHACYRGSRAATAATVAMLAAHRSARTWHRMVDVYIALSEFAKRKYIEGGLPRERIVVKPNHIHPDPGKGDRSGGYALFVGRLSDEKGVRILREAWSELVDVPLVLVGDGPMRDLAWPSQVRVLGRRSHDEVLGLMRRASVLVFPSQWYECAPLTILEAFACGVPVIASNLGVMSELVTDELTGLLFKPGDASDLRRCVRWVFEHKETVNGMGAHARAEFELKYTAERSYAGLMRVYARARGRLAQADGIYATA